MTTDKAFGVDAIAAALGTTRHEGITIFDGQGLNRKILFKTFEEELRTFCATESPRFIAILEGDEQLITDATAKEHAITTFSYLCAVSAGFANKAHNEDYFW